MQAPPPPRARRPQARAHLAQLRSNGRAVFRGQGTKPARMPTSMPTSTKGLTALAPKLVQHRGQLAADPLADTTTQPPDPIQDMQRQIEDMSLRLDNLSSLLTQSVAETKGLRETVEQGFEHQNAELETWVMKLKEVFEPEQEDFMDPSLFQEDAFVQE
ncbi:hypothetical protein BKA67DRAFT_647354 [Truncatella angustata]|uniref:Uncharacterized protein n=1 Tax=Truncatella angustata TaxID=152316 RepID=A0A9P8UJR9_9PEZI|nr:uncharacterized protein BKA67DRAFT_647354 [Truncatella angustata]KAH6653487.1 hypothetical protein BKA67DRAFT_647354 [Truncatella angustata]